jgi:hypothetical protein
VQREKLFYSDVATKSYRIILLHSTTYRIINQSYVEKTNFPIFIENCPARTTGKLKVGNTHNRHYYPIKLKNPLTSLY